jgi:hypothetical protein
MLSEYYKSLKKFFKKFRPDGKKNARDLCRWFVREKLNAFSGPDRILGSSRFYVDYSDLPDRYFINSDIEPFLGRRR